MTYTADTPIRGGGKGDPGMILDWARDRGCRRPDDVEQYLDTVYRIAPELDLNPDVVVVQSIHETTENGVPWGSLWWSTRANPAGIGITGDARRNAVSRDFINGHAAAMAHLLHLNLYVNGASVPPGFLSSDDPRWDNAIDAGFAGIASTLDDLTNRWAVDKDYGAKLASRLNMMESAGLLEGMETPVAVNFVAHKVPGLDKPLHLPDDIQVHIRLINNSNWGSQARYTGQTMTTWHDTGPTGGNADAEFTWANGGRSGAGAAGYQAIIDDDEIYITHPFDRVTWHAGGDGKGNSASYGAEQCREGVNRAKSIRNTAYFHAAVCVAKGWQVDTALVQHHYWYGKNCPSYIRANGLWSSAVKQTQDAAAEIRRFLAGEVTAPQPQPTPTYAAPAIIPELDAVSKSEGVAPIYMDGGGTRWFWVGDRVKTTKATKRFRYADRASESVGPDLKANEEFDVDWITEFNGELWYYTPWGTRIAVSDVVRISDTKGEAEA